MPVPIGRIAVANPDDDHNSGRKRPQQDPANNHPRQQQQQHECIIELNPPERERTTRAPRTFRISSSESDGDRASMSAGEEQQRWYDESEADDDDGSGIPTSFSFPQKMSSGICQSNGVDGEQIVQSSISQLPQQQQPSCQVYRGENLCPFCGYKCVRISLNVCL